MHNVSNQKCIERRWKQVETVYFTTFSMDETTLILSKSWNHSYSLDWMNLHFQPYLVIRRPHWLIKFNYENSDYINIIIVINNILGRYLYYFRIFVYFSINITWYLDHLYNILDYTLFDQCDHWITLIFNQLTRSPFKYNYYL